MEFGELKFTKKELASLSKPILRFLVGSSMAANDVVVFQRLVIQHFPENSASELVREYQWTHYNIIVRALAGKIYEYIHLIEIFKNLLKRTSIPNKDEFVSRSNAFLEIKNSEAYEAVRLLRDKVTHHYGGAGIPSNLSPYDDDQQFSLYVHRVMGNSLAPLGEEIGALGLLASQSKISDYHKVIDWLVPACGKVSMFQHHTMVLILQTFFPAKRLKKRRVPVEARLIGDQDMRIPIIIDIIDKSPST